MRARKRRSIPVLVSLSVLLGLAGLIAPGALGSETENGFTVSLINQPKDALENETITSVPLNPNQGFLKVRVTDGESGVAGVEVTFVLAEGTGLASGGLLVIPQTTNANGIATFGPGTVSIGDANEPQFTDYKLVPMTIEPPPSGSLALTLSSSSGAPSAGFDIFEEGCRGTGCSVAIRGGNDVYTTTQNVRLTASVLNESFYPGLSCRNQTLVFTEDVFVHETSGSGVVGLVNHVTFGDLTGGEGGGGGGAATLGVANGDDDDPDDDDGVRIKWCVGTKTRTPWVRNGAPFTRQDTNGDGRLDLYVGAAPRCPRNNPKSFAPCIVSRVSDGEGGFFLRGWLPGGDPPRRT